MNHKPFNRLRLAAPAITAALLALVIGNSQAISDWVRLYDYTPPPAVASLAMQTDMTPIARHLLYVNRPEIDDRDTFNLKCSGDGEQTIVLGCYHSKDRGIFIFAVEDSRLDGVEQVTAAHEMLHAAYDRLSGSDKKTIDSELQDFYDHDLHDQRVRDTIESYKKSEPNDVINEMHSIFGTEVAALTPQLQQYYTRYFTDRSKVTGFAAAYEEEFTSRTDQVKAYDAQLSSLKVKIDTNTATLKSEQSALNATRSQMESDRAGGDIAGYNAQVPSYNRQVDSYNALVRETHSEVSQYNTVVAERNSLVLEVQQLSHSIDSQFKPITK